MFQAFQSTIKSIDSIPFKEPGSMVNQPFTIFYKKVVKTTHKIKRRMPPLCFYRFIFGIFYNPLGMLLIPFSSCIYTHRRKPYTHFHTMLLYLFTQWF